MVPMPEDMLLTLERRSKKEAQRTLGRRGASGLEDGRGARVAFPRFLGGPVREMATLQVANLPVVYLHPSDLDGESAG